MRISYKLVILMTCAMVSTSFGFGKPAKDAKMTVKDANAPAKEVKEVNAVKPAEKKVETIKEAAAPAIIPSVIKPVESTDTAVTVNGIVIT